MGRTKPELNSRFNFLALTIATGISLVVTFILVIIFALFIKWFNWSDAVILPVHIFIKITSLALGVFIATKDSRGGILKGSIIGFIYTTICFLIFSLLAKSFEINLSLLYDYLLCVISGIILGIICVNIRK